MNITLQRECLEIATLGRVRVNGETHSHSLELPWKNNMPGISCIPPGVYGLEFFDSPKFKRPILRLKHVPGREAIEIHPANHVAELRGCIALGIRMAVNPEYLIESRKSVDSLAAIVRLAMDRKEAVTLDVRNPE